MLKNSETNTLSNFDIIEFAKSILNEVESIRSYVETIGDVTVNGNTSQQEFNIPVESRVNTFFRLIGLPMFITLEKKNDKMVSNIKAGKQFINAGFFGAKLDGFNIKNTDENYKFSTSKSSSELANRENFLNQIENSIGTEEMNNYMTAALRSSMPVIPNTKGSNGEIIGTGISERKVFKKLFPLVTSYKEIYPKMNEVSRPFVTDINLQQITNTIPLKIPFIEVVARIRLVSCGNAQSKKEKDKIEETSEAAKIILGEEGYKKVSNDDSNIISSLNGTGLLEQHIISKLMGSIKQLANKWTRLQTQQEALYEAVPYSISIKTTSSKRSIFGKRASVSADLLSKDTSKFAKQLKPLNEKIAIEEALLSILFPSNDIIKKTNGIITNNRSTSLSSLIDSFSQLLSSNLEQFRKQVKTIETNIKRKTQETERLRVQLEMMTGEFTGLSIIDVIAVIIGLFIIKKEHLVAMLDTFVKDDMKKDNVLKAALTSLNNPDGIEAAENAIFELQKIVKWVFDLFNYEVKVIKYKKLRSGKTEKKK